MLEGLQHECPAVADSVWEALISRSNDIDHRTLNQLH